MTRLLYGVEWAGEQAAGIPSGYEEVTIQCRFDRPLDADLIEYWRETIAKFYDGAHVKLIETENSR